MKPKTYKVLELCVETGVKYGLARTYKHTDSPSLAELEDNILSAIDYELCEWFDFEVNND